MHPREHVLVKLGGAPGLMFGFMFFTFMHTDHIQSSCKVMWECYFTTLVTYYCF